MVKKFLIEMDIKVSKLIFRHVKCFIPSIAATISSVIFPSFISKIIDDGLVNNNLDLVFLYWVQMLICGTVMVLFNYIHSISYCNFEQELYCDLKNKTLEKVLHLKENVKDKTLSGDLYKSLDDDLGSIASYLAVILPELIISIITLLSIIYMILKYYSVMGILILALICVLAFSQPWFGRQIKKYSFISRETGGNEAAFLQEVISNSSLINMMGYTSPILNRYFEKSRIVKESNKKLLNIQYIAQNVRLSINTVALLITIIVGTFLVSGNKIGVGVVFAMTIYIQRVSGPLNGIVQNYLLTKSYAPLFERIIDICNKSKKESGEEIFPQEKLERISINELSYGFSSSPMLYSKFSLKIEKGEILGIVGSNGTGKTTLIKILMKALPFEEGEIIINKKYELRDLDEQYLNQNISIVPQMTMLLTGKLRDVLNPTKKEISDNEIIHLLNLYTVDYAIFNYDLDHEIAEKGLNVSGGEAQKLSLVRMAIEAKPWVILDEPTSAMDNYSEKVICNILKDYFKGRTAIIITHRPEILKICDRVVKLDG